MKTRITPLLVLMAASPAALAAPPDTAAVEFYNRDLDHYFVTATSSEALFLDSGTAGRWQRTGRSFPAWLTKAAAPADAQPVCRFYSSGANSHFYTASASECAGLKAMEASGRAAGGAFRGWGYEGIAFYIQAPTAGACPAGTAALTRAYNDGFATGAGSNHRLVDDASLAQLMADQAWVIEGTTMCAQTKASGSFASLRSTTARFAALVGTWEGTGKWQAETATTETRTLAPLSLTLAEDGSITGAGAGCTFEGDVMLGDGFRSHFQGAITASGCTDPLFDGAYDRLHFERLGQWGLHVHMKREDAGTEVMISAILDNNADTPPLPTLSGSWTGVVAWKAETETEGDDDEAEVKVNQELTLSFTDTGEVTGTGFGCTFTGTVTPQLALGRNGLRRSMWVGDLEATGCTEPVFDGAYSRVRLRADAPGQLEVKMTREADDGTTETEVKIDGTLMPVV